MSVIYKAGSSFPPLKRVVIYFSRGNSPLSNKMEYNCFSFHIFPTGIATPSLVTTTGCFSYKERINDRRQTARAVASERTAGHIRFIYGTDFRCCQQIVDSLIESGLHPLKTPLLEQAAKTLKRAMFISRFLPPDRSNRTASP